MTDDHAAPPEIRTYAIREVAEMMGEGVSLRALQDKCRTGELRAVKVGAGWRVTHANVVAFLNGEAGVLVRTPPPAAAPADAPPVSELPLPSLSDAEEKRWPGGQLRTRCPLEDGVRHGELESYHEDGTRAARGRYVRGALEGDWEQWHANGRRHVRGTFRGGLQEGRWTYWAADGTRTQEIDYAAGRLHGRSVQYHDNGTVWCEGRHEAGKSAGEWCYFDRDGKPI